MCISDNIPLLAEAAVSNFGQPAIVQELKNHLLDLVKEPEEFLNFGDISLPKQRFNVSIVSASLWATTIFLIGR